MTLSDQQLIDAAKQAGLCLPECWHLELTDEDVASEEAWVQAGLGEGPTVGRTRQEILDSSRQQRDERLQQLHRFVELVQVLSTTPPLPKP